MNFKIVLPNTNISMVDWFIKHEVSIKVCTLEVAISRALDSLE